MGWNSWNKFACNVNEKIIRDTADAMASNGMKEAGYQYIVIDDCWHGQRDENGFITADPVKFPSGNKGLTLRVPTGSRGSPVTILEVRRGAAPSRRIADVGYPS